MITQIDPAEFGSSSTVQVDTDQGDYWSAVADVERWAAEHGFLPVGGAPLRRVMVEGHGRYRAICYRLSDEDAAAVDDVNRRRHERAARMQPTEPVYER